MQSVGKNSPLVQDNFVTEYSLIDSFGDSITIRGDQTECPALVTELIASLLQSRENRWFRPKAKNNNYYYDHPMKFSWKYIFPIFTLRILESYILIDSFFVITVKNLSLLTFIFRCDATPIWLPAAHFSCSDHQNIHRWLNETVIQRSMDRDKRTISGCLRFSFGGPSSSKRAFPPK